MFQNCEFMLQGVPAQPRAAALVMCGCCDTVGYCYETYNITEGFGWTDARLTSFSLRGFRCLMIVILGGRPEECLAACLQLGGLERDRPRKPALSVTLLGISWSGCFLLRLRPSQQDITSSLQRPLPRSTRECTGLVLCRTVVRFRKT